MARNERGGGRRSAFFRGKEGMQQTDRELEEQKRRSEERKQAGNMPFRFRVPVGETRQIIICDDAPDFFMYEHALKDSEGRWGRLFSGCTKTFDNCPVCESQDRESYYAMVLTCIDLTPFTTRDGDEVEFSRKLLIVKPAQQKKFLRFYQREGTLRGALFDMTRDGEKDSAIGNDIEFVEFVPEKEMETYTRSWKDRDGKRHDENCDEPFDYEELFEEPDTEKLRALVGGAPAAGSRAQSERELGGRSGRSSRGRRGRDDDWEDDKDKDKFEDEEKPRRGRRSAKVEEEEEEDTPRRRGRRAAQEAEEEEPPRRRGRRSAKSEEAENPEDPDDPPWEEDEEEETPRRGRRAKPDPEPEGEEEEDTPRSRRAARRGRR